jgi:hypothetical protein
MLHSIKPSLGRIPLIKTVQNMLYLLLPNFRSRHNLLHIYIYIYMAGGTAPWVRAPVALPEDSPA